MDNCVFCQDFFFTEEAESKNNIFIDYYYVSKYYLFKIMNIRQRKCPNIAYYTRTIFYVRFISYFQIITYSS